MLAGAVQTTLEEAIPLAEVTFCVVDLETTGGSPTDSHITEIGAVKYRGGERIGVFETLVNPEVPIPRFITHLTGIDDLAVAGAPPIEWTLPLASRYLLGTHRLVVRDHDGRLLRFANGWLVRDAADAPLPRPCPRERADEPAAVRSWLEHHAVRVEEAGPPLAEPVDGGAALHRLLTRLRTPDPAGRR